jgi:hypothetical protein
MDNFPRQTQSMEHNGNENDQKKRNIDKKKTLRYPFIISRYQEVHIYF